MKVTKTLAFLVAILGFPFSAYSQAFDVSRHVAFAMELGRWQPHSLNNGTGFMGFDEPGVTPYMGISFVLPVGGGAGILLSAGYWSLVEKQGMENRHSLVLCPLSLDVKYWFGPDYPLAPYVRYGTSIIWGIENGISLLDTGAKEYGAAWGLRLGAGFDLTLFRRVGLGMSFEYLLVYFSRALAGVNDFSGPKISGTFFIII